MLLQVVIVLSTSAIAYDYNKYIENIPGYWQIWQIYVNAYSQHDWQGSFGPRIEVHGSDNDHDGADFYSEWAIVVFAARDIDALGVRLYKRSSWLRIMQYRRLWEGTERFQQTIE